MNFMFADCKNLKSIDLSNFKTDNITHMGGMFVGCDNLNEIKGLNNFISSNINNMNSMFYECKNLISINLSNFKTDNVNDMSYMFYGCLKLVEINLYNFKLNQKCKIENIFNGINKKECKLIAQDKDIKNIFKYFIS